MAESLTRETKCVYVDTSLDTHLLVPLHDRETISDFKVKLCKEHLQCFPQYGDIDISAVKVNRENTLGLLLDYHLPDSTLLSMVLDGISCWSVFVDAAVKIEKSELPSENCLNLELLPEKDKNDSLEAEKTRKKRKLKVSNGQKRQKKPKLDLNQSSAAAADVDTLPETTTKEIERSVEGDGIDKTETDDHLETNIGLTARPDAEKKTRRKKGSDTNQTSATANVEEGVDASLPISKLENLDDSVAVVASKKENELVQISIDDVGRDQTETDNLVSHTANHLDTVSEVTTRPDREEKKKRRSRKKRSKVAIGQSFSPSGTSSRDTVNEVKGVSANVDSLDAANVDSVDVEPNKAVEGEEADNIIRNVSASLLEKKETEENNASLEIADSEVLSVEVNNATLEVAQSQDLSVEVNNDALEETPLMNNPQDAEDWKPR